MQHIIHHLADNGTGAVILPHGVLFRSGAERVIREYIIRELNMLDAVIGLPANLFYGTGIPACVLVLRTCREQDGDIFFIDADRDFEKAGTQNILTPDHVDRIVGAWAARRDVEHYARAVPLAEIEDNGFNLNIPRYVDTFEKEDPIDLTAEASGLQDLDRAAMETDGEIAGFCATLEIPSPGGRETG